MYRFVFPDNNRAAKNTDLQQAQKVLEEATELRDAMRQGESSQRVLEEAFDTLHALEGILSRFTDAELSAAIIRVRGKNTMRGDYSPINTTKH